MTLEEARWVYEQLEKLFESRVRLLQVTEGFSVFNATTTVWEFTSISRQPYIARFTVDGTEALIMVQPPVGMEVVAQTPKQGAYMITRIKAHLGLEIDVIKKGIFVSPYKTMEA